jgi:hypothetical protein
MRITLDKSKPNQITIAPNDVTNILVHKIIKSNFISSFQSWRDESHEDSDQKNHSYDHDV